MNIKPETWAAVVLDCIPEPHPLGHKPEELSYYRRWKQAHQDLSDFHQYKFSPPPRD